MEKKEKYNIVFIFAFGLFLLLLFMCIQTPLAGDDWGYALNGMNFNPFAKAIEFYSSWSGRFFSELFGFIFAPRKWVWNAINPLLFTVIFLLIVFYSKKNMSIKAAITIMLMLGVNEFLRMETYTWVMGTTYVIPLLLSLLYFTLIFKCKDKKGMIIYTNVILFYIGLTIENIAGIMVLATIALNVKYYIDNKKLDKMLISNLIISIISLVIMRLSPGSASRLIMDHPDWVSLSLLDKIDLQLSNFVSYTFLENKILLFVLGLVLIILGIKNYKDVKNKTLLWICEAVICFSLVMLASLTLYRFIPLGIFNALSNPSSKINLLLWIIYIVAVYIVIILCAPKAREKALFFITLGGAGNVAMLLSPIFGARSSIYFVYFTILAIILLLDEFEPPYFVKVIIICICVVIVVLKGLTIIEKYNQVSATYTEDKQIIENYNGENELTLYRMPPYSIHGFDIEDDDTYHMEVFKKYFNIDEKTIIHFIYKDTYK